MTQPTTFGGRPLPQAPAVPTPEQRVARFRPRATFLLWPALFVIVTAGATAFSSGNLPEPLQDWMLWAVAAIAVLVVGVLPYLAWLGHVYTVTTRRVIERSGVVRTTRREIGHVRGYTVTERRGPLQRIGGAGTLTLSNGVDEPLVLRNVPDVALVHEVLVDQVEVNQILAHRDAQPVPGTEPGITAPI